jgi:Kae1-associated kinase Bud32
MKIIDKGAEADIFSETLFNKSTIVKVRKPKRYRIAELDSSIRKTRTKREAKVMYRANKAGISTPRIYAIGKFSIYMERIKGKLLKDTIQKPSMYSKLGTELGMLHKNDIAHGDFTPANVMINGNRLCIIDFGLSEVTKSIEEKALDLLLMKRSINKGNYDALVRSYKKDYAEAKDVLERLDKIEERGRYKIRTLE